MLTYAATSAVPQRMKERGVSGRPSAAQFDREPQQYQREKERGSEPGKEQAAAAVGGREKSLGKYAFTKYFQYVCTVCEFYILRNAVFLYNVFEWGKIIY